MALNTRETCNGIDKTKRRQNPVGWVKWICRGRLYRRYTDASLYLSPCLKPLLGNPKDAFELESHLKSRTI